MELLNTVIRLHPGMYILRHPAGGLAPISLGIAPGPSAVGRVERLSTSGTQGSLLRDGSDCIVMLVTIAPVDIVVTAFLTHRGDAVPQLRVDRIGLDPVPVATADAPTVPPGPAVHMSTPTPSLPERAAPPPHVAAPPKPPLQVPPRGISLIGHIERRGDMVAAPGTALGDSASDLRLEGFQVAWPDRPEGVDLTYGIVVEGAGKLPEVSTGRFCGTRGEARRIVGVKFALVGPNANAFELHGTAHFTGGFDVAVRSSMTLSGPSGLEHLTSLRLDVAPRVDGRQANPWNDPARTRTFKAAHTNLRHDHGQTAT